MQKFVPPPGRMPSGKLLVGAAALCDKIHARSWVGAQVTRYWSSGLPCR
jgi:hypothetical protein